jgi:hypothetical protein
MNMIKALILCGLLIAAVTCSMPEKETVSKEIDLGMKGRVER